MNSARKVAQRWATRVTGEVQRAQVEKDIIEMEVAWRR